MKKLFIIALSTLSIAFACKNEGVEIPLPPPEPIVLPEVTVSGPHEIYPDEKGTFKATLNEEAKGKVTIKITIEHSNVLTLAAEEIIIEKGKTNGEVAFTGKSEGLTKVSFTSADATVKTPELAVSVPIVDKWPTYPYFENGTFSAISKIVIGDTTVESSAADSPDGANGRLVGNDDFRVGGVSDNEHYHIVPMRDKIPFTIYYDNYTANDGTEMAVAMYINWNGDLDFDDQDEEVLVVKGIPANDKKEISGTISIPANAVSSAIIRVLCYSVKDSEMMNGVGNANSGYLMELMYNVNW